jgi:Asp-tRNA(Asn)/Glu-tRNA(Gln) amidotransferase A subunit family amidase
MDQQLCWMSAIDLAEAIRSKRVSPVEALEAILSQVDAINPALNAIVTRTDSLAREQARDAEARVMRGDALGPLDGVPITFKDLHYVAGVRATLGSRLFEDFVPDWDHPIVERLRAAGAIVLGKTNTSEFGLTPLVDNSLFGETNNPWNLNHNTGGSSGGSAAAVASGMGPLATGSDGGGSIRIPASFCGIFGLKPHLGRIPHVAHPRGWETLSHQGPLSRTVADTALMLEVTAGPHPLDRRSLAERAPEFLSACGEEVAGLRLGWVETIADFPIEPQVADVCRQGARNFEDLGCHVESITLDIEDLTRAQQVIVLCEAATSMQSRREEWQEVIHPSMKRLLPNADKLTYQQLLEAHWSREAAWEKLAGMFDSFDALLMPTAPITAPLNGTLGPREIAGQKIRALQWLIYCVPFNMTWQPAASLPVGFDDGGLPIGLQLVGDRFDERMLLRLASAYEAAYPWADRIPPVCQPTD